MKYRARAKVKIALPTDAELIILGGLWELGEGTVEEVTNWLPSNPRANYKTTQAV
jgi:predicted transcriptional regulator